MKYTTFAAIKKSVLIGAPVIGFVFLIRSCAGCGDTQPPLQEQPYASQQHAPQPQMQAPTAKPQYGAQELPLSSTEQEILQLQKEPLSLGKQDDNGSLKRTVKKGSVKLDIRCDQNKGFTSWNRIKVDWDNNKKYDEKWNFRPDGTVARFVSPNDDEDYSIEYRLYNNVWKLK